MKKAFLLLCATSIMLFFSYLPVFAQEKTIVGISTPTDDHGWTGGVMWWVQEALEEFSVKYPNAELIYLPSDTDKKQAKDVELLLTKGINALVILPHKPAPLTTVLNKAHSAGVYIIVVDRSIPRVPKDIYLAGDNYGFGYKSGEYLTKTLGGKGNILVMEGIPCEGNNLRVNGFRDGLKGSGVVIMDSQPAYWNPAKGYELMLLYLQQFPKIDAIWCGDDDVMESALRAYAESGRKDIQFFLGGGGSKAVIKRILDGDPLVRATVTYPPKMLYDAIQVSLERLTENKDFPKEILIPSELVTKENAKSYYYPDSMY